MLRAKDSPLLLCVATLLLGSCCGTEEARVENAEISHQNCSNVTFNSTEETHSLAYGLTASLGAILLYGSSVVPVKKVETGDGIFYHWVSCASIWFASMIGDVILHSPKFYPLAMLGGVIWATGNLAIVPTVKAIGLGLTVLISGSLSMFIGWASSRFGWFGIDPQYVPRPMLNYCGAGLCLLSCVIFFFVKVTVEQQPSSEFVPLLFDRQVYSGSFGCGSSYSEFWIDSVEPKTRRYIGYMMAVIMGLFYGSFYIPVLYIKDHSTFKDSMYYGASLFDLDYLYSLCCGIFSASTFYFVIYCALMNNRPRVYARAILPGISSGIMWALGTSCWFLASNYLSSVITFPIMSAGYSLVAAMWASLVFREIKGFNNWLLFFLASCVTIAGTLMTAISKV